MATLEEREIASTIATVSKLKFVDVDWVINGISQHLRTFRFQRSWLQKLLGLRGYPRSIPEKIGHILSGAHSLTLSQITDKVVRLRLQPRHARAVVLYLQSSRLRDLGFPLYEISDVAGLFSASLYRFAYGSSDRLEPEEVWRAWDFQGAYRIFLRRTGSDNYESRILALWLNNSPQAIMALEISRAINNQLRVRVGPAAPAFDFQTILLSDQFDNTLASTVLEDHYDPAIAAADKIDLGSAYRASDDLSLLQSQSLQVYALRNEAAGLIAGTFHWKGEVGTVVGRKISHINRAELAAVNIILKSQIPNLGSTDIDLIERLASTSPKIPRLATLRAV